MVGYSYKWLKHVKTMLQDVPLPVSLSGSGGYPGCLCRGYPRGSGDAAALLMIGSRPQRLPWKRHQ